MELAVCHHYRIPHSQFLGWAEQDRDKAIWWHVRQLQTCQSCGTRSEEWDETRGGRRDAYGPQSQICRGCEVKQGYEASIHDEQGRGERVVLIRNPEVNRADP